MWYGSIYVKYDMEYDDDYFECFQVWSSAVDHHRGEVRRHLGQRAPGKFLSNFHYSYSSSSYYYYHYYHYMGQRVIFNSQMFLSHVNHYDLSQDGYGSETYADGGTYQVTQQNHASKALENIGKHWEIVQNIGKYQEIMASFCKKC